MSASRSRIGKRYQTVIPPAVRKALRVKEGAVLEWVVDPENRATVRVISSYTDELARLGREIWRDADGVREAIAENQNAWPE